MSPQSQGLLERFAAIELGDDAQAIVGALFVLAVLLILTLEDLVRRWRGGGR